MGEIPLISIGKLSKATGFAVERLRMWELRYGAPLSQRLGSGHRRYRLDEVERIHLVREALARGGRPRHIVGLAREALLELLGSPRQGKLEPGSGGQAPASLPWAVVGWVAAVAVLDDTTLDRQFYQQWLELGSLRFLTERAQPFVDALALGRASGELGLAEERYGLEKLCDFLNQLWRRLNEDNDAGPILLTTPLGDPWHLGLQMVASILTLAGLRVVNLGPALPPGELAAFSARRSIPALLLVLSPGLEPAEEVENLRPWRTSLPVDVLLYVGSAEASQVSEGIKSFRDLSLLHRWAMDWGLRHPGVRGSYCLVRKG
jgi:hypothetical protein